MISAESSSPNNDVVQNLSVAKHRNGPRTKPDARLRAPPAKMSMFRAKKLDLGCFINTRVIRDHTKRKVVEQHEPER